MLLIKNGRVVDPVNGVDKVMDVLVDGGQIVMTGDKAVDMFDEAKASAGIGEAGNIVCGSDVNYEENAFNVIDAAGLVVAPGLVDTGIRGLPIRRTYLPGRRRQPRAASQRLCAWQIPSLRSTMWILLPMFLKKVHRQGYMCCRRRQ